MRSERDKDPIKDPIVCEFAELARGYIALIDRQSELTACELLEQAGRHLTRIYAAWWDLPNVEPESIDPLRYDGPSPMTTLQAKLGKYNNYCYVYDPTSESDSIGSSLADDLADIYVDLKGSLIGYDRGQRRNAVWQWSFDIRYHSGGDHILSALRVIHQLVTDSMDPNYVADIDNT